MGALCCRPEDVDFETPVSLWHFYLLRSLGKGAFGKVRVVQHKQTGELYALKYMNKTQIVQLNAINNVIQERKILEEIDSPFVCNLRYAFQDDSNLFMVIDLMLGGDLRFHLERNKTLPEDWVRFYVAEIAAALDYIHSKRIVHRDIKPENIVLDEQGHAHLTDFNIAVHVPKSTPLTTVAGSMAYMAPEILQKKGYSTTIDWWSLGIVTYELLYGKRPIRGITTSYLTDAILHDRVVIPRNADLKLSEECLACLEGLLQKNPTKRLGSDFRAFQQHPWFSELDWDQLSQKKITPPFVCDPNQFNFSTTHELEELLLEENPLSAKKRDPHIVLEHLGAEFQTMESNFLDYDFRKREHYPQRVLAEEDVVREEHLINQCLASGSFEENNHSA